MLKVKDKLNDSSFESDLQILFLCITDQLSRFSLEFEDVFLLLVVERHLAGGLLQSDGDLAVIRDALSRALLVLIEAHLLLVYHTVHVVPRPADKHTLDSYRNL